MTSPDWPEWLWVNDAPPSSLRALANQHRGFRSLLPLCSLHHVEAVADSPPTAWLSTTLTHSTSSFAPCWIRCFLCPPLHTLYNTQIMTICDIVRIRKLSCCTLTSGYSSLINLKYYFAHLCRIVFHSTMRRIAPTLQGSFKACRFELWREILTAPLYRVWILTEILQYRDENTLRSRPGHACWRLGTHGSVLLMTNGSLQTRFHSWIHSHDVSGSFSHHCCPWLVHEQSKPTSAFCQFLLLILIKSWADIYGSSSVWALCMGGNTFVTWHLGHLDVLTCYTHQAKKSKHSHSLQKWR